MMTAEDYEKLFIEADCDEWYAPSGFDWENASRKSEELHRVLCSRLGRECRYFGPSVIQDATFHCAIDLPSDLTGSDWSRPVRVSNFGSLVSIQGESAVKTEVVETVKSVVEALGYIYVPESLLLKEYKGVLRGDAMLKTWRDRYFTHC